MLTSRIVRWAALAVVVVGCAIVVRAWAGEATEQPAKEEPLVLRVYDVKDLLVVPKDHSSNESSYTIQINTHLPFVMAAGVATGDIGFFGPGMPEPSPVSAQLVSIIQRTVNNLSDRAVAAWSDEGGPAAIEYLAPVLVITQTAAAHKKIEGFLDQYRQHLYRGPTVTIQARWVQADAGKAQKLLAGQPRADALVVTAAALDEAGAKTVFQGHVRCRDCQTVHMVSGEYQTYMADVEPVISGGSLGAKSSSNSLMTGAALQVKPILSPDGQSATLDVYSYVADLKELRSKSLPDFGQVKGNAQTMGLDLEMPSVFVHTFATTAKVPLGKPVLVGSMTQPGEKKDKVLLLVLEVSAAK